MGGSSTRSRCCQRGLRGISARMMRWMSRRAGSGWQLAAAGLHREWLPKTTQDQSTGALRQEMRGISDSTSLGQPDVVQEDAQVSPRGRR